MSIIKSRFAMVLVGAAFGLAAGVGFFTFVYAKGASYLTNDPRACANCHIMREHYDGWTKSTHHSIATCNDCHTPPDFVGKYMTKADHGFWHSYGFTTGRFADPIRIKPSSRKIVEDACRRCHGPIVEAIAAKGGKDGDISCIRCHSSAGHLR